jgi:predicted alpha/beta superfamily hydrolase
MWERLREHLKMGAEKLRPMRRNHAAGELGRRVQGPHVTGELIVHADFASRILGNRRDLWVYLPPGYHEDGDRHYPVLYMHDGNNLFDEDTAFGGTEWSIDETAEMLIQAGQLPPLVIVGVSNTAERLEEYTWALCAKMGGGKGAQYAKFLIDEVHPFVASHYRIRAGQDHTGVIGSSLGGLISLYLGAHHGDFFGRVGAMSPSLWWSDRRVITDLASVRPDLRLWLDMGSREGDDETEWAQNLADAATLRRLFENRGYQDGENFLFWEAEGADHSETAWAGRSALALQFMFADDRAVDGGLTG